MSQPTRHSEGGISNNISKSAMVSIGTHKLYLSTSGPSRKPREPIILLMQGLSSTLNEWVAVKRGVTAFAPWVEYDRSGLGKSESPPIPPESISAASVAAELSTLLENAGIQGPFIIVCHSWGGITSREFLHLRQKDVVGMIFLDANTERNYDGGDWPHSYVENVCAGLDWVEVTGLASNHVLSTEEFQAILQEQQRPRHQATEEAETRGYRGDPAILAAKNQFDAAPLGDWPVSVITARTDRDFQRAYNAGVAAGNGTEEERGLFRKLLATWAENDHNYQAELLKLSTFGRHLHANHSGHNVQMVEPELVVQEIKWVWDHVAKRHSSQNVSED
jgi:pimeloyl-ACP methyl ester carboxylesterase